MKNLKNVLFILLGVLSIGFITTSCNDEFSEKDLLELQVQLGTDKDSLDAVRQLAALNAAGSMLDYTLNLHSDDAPAAGVDVTITNQTDGASLTVQSDASGNAVFPNLELGGHTVTIVSANHLNISYLLDFGVPYNGVHYTIINGNVLPIKTSEASKVELFGFTGLQTGTIVGRIQIETDLTNNSTEIPQNISVRANLDSYSPTTSHTEIYNQFGGGGSIYVTGSLTYSEGDIGTATVDNTTGSYTMTVPATNAGTSVKLLMPYIEADQTLAFSMVNGVDVGAQVGTQPTRFNASTTASAVPAIAGVQAVFPAPPTAGSGFTVGSFAPFGRTFGASTINTFPVDISNNRKVRWSKGAGFQAQPDVVVSGGGTPTTTATIEPLMEWLGTDVALNGAGTGYAVSDQITVQIQREPDNAVVATVTFVVDAIDGSGGVTVATLTAPLNGTFWTTPYSSGNFDLTSIVALQTATTGVGTSATFSLTYGGEIVGHDITDAGDGYTSAPTLTLSGGTPTTTATALVENMAFQFTFTVDNSATSAYVLVPDEIAFTGLDINGDNAKSTQADYVNTSGNAAGATAAANSFLRVVSGGNVEFHMDTYTDLQSGLTSSFYTGAPSPVVSNAVHVQAKATIEVTNGEITDLLSITAGTGYTSPVSITIQTLAGLPGTGASITLTGFTVNTTDLEVVWGSAFTIQSGGADYSDDANITVINAPANPVASVTNGGTTVINYNYGTGVTIEKVE